MRKDLQKNSQEYKAPRLKTSQEYGNPPCEDLRPSWEVFDETRVKVWLSQNPRSPSLLKLSRQGKRQKAYTLARDLRTELGYFSEEYDEEREMEPRLEQNRETTPPLRMRSPRVPRQRERVVGFEESPSREGGRIERNVEGSGPSELGTRENGSRGNKIFLHYFVAHLGRSELDKLSFFFDLRKRGHQALRLTKGVRLT
ncbi:hypothetical protein Tco_0767508 [Tanacetum coccineum]